LGDHRVPWELRKARKARDMGDLTYKKPGKMVVSPGTHGSVGSMEATSPGTIGECWGNDPQMVIFHYL